MLRYGCSIPALRQCQVCTVRVRPPERAHALALAAIGSTRQGCRTRGSARACFGRMAPRPRRLEHYKYLADFSGPSRRAGGCGRTQSSRNPARSVTGAPKSGPTHPGFQMRSELLINIVLDFRDTRHRAHHPGEICVALKGEAATRREHHVLRQRIAPIRLDKPSRQNYTTAANFPLIDRGRSGATINWLR
jgi:hypothetical protein